jgi:hypothetical protein
MTRNFEPASVSNALGPILGAAYNEYADEVFHSWSRLLCGKNCYLLLLKDGDCAFSFKYKIACSVAQLWSV